ncbi:tonB-system energizer ExbB [Rhizobium glycinendophyticum]|uniref:Biopolymer transport protein ExbB n=1 Tax=Rhizobium glycinendophyticum TaxID=2589807 RepID=A0A504UJ58_9HYPH|nr:tonB-system energizer ExbB [Rhizobium glycinendophyticum]TPP05412.1 tonB-system energizer ExbB [Rhizobium glycinendophyticum]
MPLIHSGQSTLRIGVSLAAFLVASAASAQAPASGTPTETGTAQGVISQSAVVTSQANTTSNDVPATPGADAPPASAPAEVAPQPTTAAEVAPAINATSENVTQAEAVPAAAASQPVEEVVAAPAAEAEPSDVVPVKDTLPHDLSPVGMFMAADWIVKSVMLALGFASLVTWTVWLAKTLQLFGARARAARGLKAVTQARSLKDALTVLESRGGVVAMMVRSAQHEMTLSDGAIDRAGAEGVKERVASALGRIEVRAGRQMSKGTGVLASIGSTAPFVGLFGTVWGIMNSFIGIAETQTTNLAVVAPGIAEALLATAVGLVAAIPAVIIYNVFARSVTGYRQLVSDAAAGIERLVSRDLDFRKSALAVRASNLQAAE